jgi:hypothetical protein
MDSASQYSETWHALNHAVRPRFWSSSGSNSEYIVICNEPVANVLRDLAHTHCMDAVAAIDLALGKQPYAETEALL